MGPWQYKRPSAYGSVIARSLVLKQPSVVISSSLRQITHRSQRERNSGTTEVATTFLGLYPWVIAPSPGSGKLLEEKLLGFEAYKAVGDVCKAVGDVYNDVVPTAPQMGW